MSAIGSYVRIRTADLDRCLELASRDSSDFAREWDAAVLEEVDFDGSGWVLSSYFLAQSHLNDLADPFDSAEGMTLAKVFTAAFPVRAPQPLPELDAKALQEFCASEWDTVAAAVCDGIVQAHAFLTMGMARIAQGEAVVFIIS